MTNELLRALTADSIATEVLAPQLTSITVQASLTREQRAGNRPFDVDVLLAMLYSRTKHPEFSGMNMLQKPLITASLQSLEFEFCPHLPDSTIAEAVSRYVFGEHSWFSRSIFLERSAKKS